MKKMKKMTAALLALAMALGLAACNPSGSTPSDAPENSGTPESAPPAVQRPPSPFPAATWRSWAPAT